MAALTGILLLLYPIRTSKVVFPVNDPTAVAAMRQSGNRIARPDSSSVATIPRGTEPEHSPGLLTDPPLQQTSSAGRSSTSPLRDIQTGVAAEGGTRAATALDL